MNTTRVSISRESLKLVQVPLTVITEDQKQSSITTIFAIWNTLIGCGIVVFPWAFGESGFLLGITICIVGYITSCRTCILIIRVAEKHKDDDYCLTLVRYWGLWGYYSCYISTLLIFIAAYSTYFIILA